MHKRPISSLALPPATLGALTRAGFENVGDLAGFESAEALSTRKDRPHYRHDVYTIPLRTQDTYRPVADRYVCITSDRATDSRLSVPRLVVESWHRTTKNNGL